MPSETPDQRPPEASTHEAPVLLGVDAGGTKSRALLATRGPSGCYCLLGVGEAGPGNPMSHGVDAAAENIASAIRQAIAAAPGAKVRVAAIAAAGAADPEARQRLEVKLAVLQLAEKIGVVTDFEPLLALADPPTLGVIAGTGSVVFAQRADGSVRRYGGWGYLLGDEGSGYAIGRRALQQCLNELEFAAARSPLAEACLDSLGVTDRGGLLAAIYKSEAQRTRIASVARAVILLAGSDAAAGAIIEAEATALARSIAAAAADSGLAPGGYTLSLGGGVLANCAAFRAALCDALNDSPAAPGRVVIVRDPAIGCLALAHRSCCG